MNEDMIKAMVLSVTVFTHSLFATLAHKGLLSSQDGIDIYEDALLSLETEQARAGGDAAVFQLARYILEQKVQVIRANSV
jgi:hypothetical protein